MLLDLYQTGKTIVLGIDFEQDRPEHPVCFITN